MRTMYRLNIHSDVLSIDTDYLSTAIYIIDLLSSPVGDPDLKVVSNC